MVETWKAESIQAVLFTVTEGLMQDDAFKIWTSVFEGTPDGFQKQPNQTSMANGSADGLSLQIQNAPGRIDLLFVPSQDPSGMPRIEDFDKTLALVIGAAKKVAKISKPVRLALVTQHFLECASGALAVKKFNDIAPVKDMPLVATDLSVTLNIRKKLNGAATDINRLVRWFTGQRQLIQVQVGPHAVQQSVVIVDQPAVMMTIDVNTVLVDNTIIKADKSAKIFDGLARETLSIRDKGYASFVG